MEDEQMADGIMIKINKRSESHIAVYFLIISNCHITQDATALP